MELKHPRITAFYFLIAAGLPVMILLGDLYDVSCQLVWLLIFAFILIPATSAFLFLSPNRSRSERWLAVIGLMLMNVICAWVWSFLTMSQTVY